MIDTSSYTQEYIRLGCPNADDGGVFITDLDRAQSALSNARRAGFYPKALRFLSLFFLRLYQNRIVR